MKVISVILVAALLIASNLSSCRQDSPVRYWQTLLEDKDWVQNLNQWLGLSYIEEKDRAAFTMTMVGQSLSPDLYSSHSAIRMLKAIGRTIENRDQIGEWIHSLRKEDGSYDDPGLRTVKPAKETEMAITVLSEVGVRPEHVESTVSFLLSLQADDGTFFRSADRDSPSDATKERRVAEGTQAVANTLLMLNLGDRIPQKTKEAVLADIVSTLGESGPFPSVLEQNLPRTAGIIALLARIDSSMVPQRAREFTAYALKEAESYPIFRPPWNPGWTTRVLHGQVCSPLQERHARSSTSSTAPCPASSRTMM